MQLDSGLRTCLQDAFLLVLPGQWAALQTVGGSGLRAETGQAAGVGAQGFTLSSGASGRGSLGRNCERENDLISSEFSDHTSHGAEPER